jgi:hypothetical protein
VKRGKFNRNKEEYTHCESFSLKDRDYSIEKGDRRVNGIEKAFR